MPQVFGEAESVESIAKGLIPQYHPELAMARIKYVFQEKAGKKGGKVVYGTVKKMSGLAEFFAEADFVILVGADQWQEMDGTKRTALVDHLLERCTGIEDDENGGAMKWATREPDVHEFATILRRHGTWNDDLTTFMSVAGSVDVDEVEEEETVSTSN